MSAPPKTILYATPEEETSIRENVRGADISKLGPFRVRAKASHAQGVLDFFADPAVSDPIYSLPRPLTLTSITKWLEECVSAHDRGECLLVLTIDEQGTVLGYSKMSVWPDTSSAELGGAMRASLQNSGSGGAGAAHTIGWMFENLGVRLICLTAALDNIRSTKLIDRMGFRRMGVREAIKPDGTTRTSHYWELTREGWEDR